MHLAVAGWSWLGSLAVLQAVLCPHAAFSSTEVVLLGTVKVCVTLQSAVEAYCKHWYTLGQLQLELKVHFEALEDPTCLWKWNLVLALLCGSANVIQGRMQFKYFELSGLFICMCTFFPSESVLLKLLWARRLYIWNTGFQRHGEVGDCWLKWEKPVCPEQREGVLSCVSEWEVLFPVLLRGMHVFHSSCPAIVFIWKMTPLFQYIGYSWFQVGTGFC